MAMLSPNLDILVIGAGQAGLALGFHLSKTPFHFQLVDRKPGSCSAEAHYRSTSSLHNSQERRSEARLTTEEQNQKTIAFVLYPGLTVFDLAGPLQIFTGVSQLAPEYRTVVVGERVEPMDTDLHVKLIPTHTFEEVPHPSVLLVPGDRASTFTVMGNEAIRSYVRSAAETAEVAGSICTGALILASVGLLEGRQATTHWVYYKILEEFGAKYVRKRWVEDGKFICSAGVSAGIDMALHLAARLTDEETAWRVQRSLGYDPHPPFGSMDYDQLGAMSAIRAALSLAALVIAAKPKRLTKQNC